MSKKRGLSVDDKRRVILNLYHDTKQPYNLKEVEQLGSKLGVVQQTIKEVNQSLVDDNLVYTDKIGSANFYWSFVSNEMVKKTAEKENFNAKLQSSEVRIEQLTDDMKKAKESRSYLGRAEKMDNMRNLVETEVVLDRQLESLKQNDPEEVNRVQIEARQVMNKANMWTDNVFQVKRFLTKTKGMSSKEADQILHLNADFDNLTEADIPKEKSLKHARNK